jgi:hypothetical protein
MQPNNILWRTQFTVDDWLFRQWSMDLILRLKKISCSGRVSHNSGINEECVVLGWYIKNYNKRIAEIGHDKVMCIGN